MIRRLNVDDVPKVREIDRLSFSSGDQYKAEFYEHIESTHEYEPYVATMPNGTIVGWILGHATGTTVRIRSISIHPSFRRRGFARTLIMEILRRHQTDVDLVVDPDNVGALALYRGLGFTQTDPDPETPHRIRMLWRHASRW